MRSSAGVILLNKEKNFLLQLRDNKTKRFPNYWAFFGGKIEKGESPQKAAKRELKEELGITLNKFKFAGKYKSNQRKEMQFIFTAQLAYNFKKLKKQQKEGLGLKIFSFKKVNISKVPRFEKTILKDLFIRDIIN